MLEEDRARILAAYASDASEGQSFETELRIRSLDGRVVHLRAVATMGVSGDSRCLRGLFLDVTERKRLEERLAAETEERKKQQAEMAQAAVRNARSAGMAEIATSVLHNIGNVLNSANVSVSMLHEAAKASKF